MTNRTQQHDAGKWVAIASKIECVAKLLNEADLRAGLPTDDGMNEFRSEIHDLAVRVFDLNADLVPAAAAKFYDLFDCGDKEANDE